jgi:hypothetical protein
VTRQADSKIIYKTLLWFLGFTDSGLPTYASYKLIGVFFTRHNVYYLKYKLLTGGDVWNVDID